MAFKIDPVAPTNSKTVFDALTFGRPGTEWCPNAASSDSGPVWITFYGFWDPPGVIVHELLMTRGIDSCITFHQLAAKNAENLQRKGKNHVTTHVGLETLNECNLRNDVSRHKPQAIRSRDGGVRAAWAYR